MKKLVIILISLAGVFLIFVFLFRISFIHGGRDWFVDNGENYAKKCVSIKIGASFDEVVAIMGKPASDILRDGKRNLLYFSGGLKTEAGIGFEFEADSLIRKNCPGTEKKIPVL